MLILENICENSSTLRAIYFINNIIEILFIAVPAALVLVLSIDIAKNVLSKDENEIKETLSKGIKRIIYASLLFFVPLVVKVSFNFLGNMGVKYLDCFSMATKENIEKYEAKEETAKEKAKEERKQELEKERQQKEEEKVQKQKEAIKQREENRSSAVTNGAAAINKKAIEFAWPDGTKKNTYSYPNGSPKAEFKEAIKKYMNKTAKISQTDCGYFVTTVVRASGYDSKFKALNWQNGAYQYDSTKWTNVKSSVSSNNKVVISKLKPGDIIQYKKTNEHQHALIYIGDNKIANAGKGSYFGKIGGPNKINNSNVKFSTLEVLRAKN